MNNSRLILVGGGGHCKSVIDVAEIAGYTIIGILDRSETVGQRVLGYEIIGTDEDMHRYADQAEFVITVGQTKSSDLRVRLYQQIVAFGGRLATIISPTSHVSNYANIGAGTVVMHNAIVNSAATIGKCCIVNTSAIIEHDTIVGDFCHVSTGAIINGTVKIGDSTFIGSQSAINQNLCIGNRVTIGAGSVVINDIEDDRTVVGVPAK